MDARIRTLEEICDESREHAEKRCSNCKQCYPAALGWFYRHKNTPDRLDCICKACARKRAAEWYSANKERGRANAKRAREAKPEYYKEQKRLHSESNRDNIAARRKARYAANKVELNVKRKAFRVKNREAILAKERAYRKAHPEMARQADKRYTQKHRATKYRITNAWNKAHRDKLNAMQLRRRARVRELPNLFTAEDWRRAIDYFGGACAACGRPPGLWHKLSADHWIAVTDPQSDNPGTVPWNIVPLCSGADGCNNSKHNRPYAEWLVERFGRQKAKQVVTRIEKYLNWAKDQSDNAIDTSAD